ncbi:ubiquitin-conjugating enzyme E2 J2 [Eurytemora carolleeae]|uniref:ubiquitin-conjugating enzyme E2 J2 n=1 Tax=Eurytemora carolleeae TaxID=1294199 RepID=UPI000C7730B6|nr:ubiquitin-conjugating enzyme E2 J2 [Eurytemora carolleeae]XP_023348857.1 ubiquitin-conjugating enzyme E2 J2 [Eurytemora carolleeae]XP_023348858.1 ubiquitin-conjugating enzyme E2 J2 [Eurytemora carolleeae]XP_023348859.1 ubiquitin-conjugating enzyme E2 J2 [Eurytemora carolleeae]|eukprot:XP_023348856.1 ubiquitin-conjugating enzyme E2 J2-like [Eurytemora affinis]
MVMKTMMKMMMIMMMILDLDPAQTSKPSNRPRLNGGRPNDRPLWRRRTRTSRTERIRRNKQRTGRKKPKINPPRESGEVADRRIIFNIFIFRKKNSFKMSQRNSSAVSRLKMDYMRLKKDPVPYIVAEPLPSNLLEWHYIVKGPGDSPYEGGQYHGKLVFPAEFPFKPPSIYMITPNGRFKTDTRLCLSISDYHPDTWNPAWSVSTILTGLLSFMLETTPTLGSIETTEREKKKFAYRSLEFNLKSKVFKDLFPDLKREAEDEIVRRNLLQSQQTVVPDESVSERSAGMPGFVSFFLNLGGIAALALLVNYVLQTLELEQ